MTFRIPQNWLYAFAAELLEEAGVSDFEDDLESLVYEVGERGWERDDDDDFFFVHFDDEDF